MAQHASKRFRRRATRVYRFLRPLRKHPRIIQTVTFPDTPLQDFSAKQAVWRFVRDLDQLSSEAGTPLKAIRAASQTAHKTYELVQEFRAMLPPLEGHTLDQWIAKVKGSPIKQLQRFGPG